MISYFLILAFEIDDDIDVFHEQVGRNRAVVDRVSGVGLVD